MIAIISCQPCFKLLGLPYKRKTCSFFTAWEVLYCWSPRTCIFPRCSWLFLLSRIPLHSFTDGFIISSLLTFLSDSILKALIFQLSDLLCLVRKYRDFHWYSSEDLRKEKSRGWRDCTASLFLHLLYRYVIADTVNRLGEKKQTMEKEKRRQLLNLPLAKTSHKVSKTMQRGNPVWEKIRDAAQESRTW